MTNRLRKVIGRGKKWYTHTLRTETREKEIAVKKYSIKYCAKKKKKKNGRIHTRPPLTKTIQVLLN